METHDAYWVGQRLFNAGLRTYRLADKEYYAMPWWKWQATLWLLRKVRRFPYIRERFDCEDHARFADVFASLFGLNTIGTVITRKHAWNIIVCSDRLHHVEPQTWQEFQAGAGIYSLEDAYVEGL